MALGTGEPAERADLLEADEAQYSRGGRFSKGRSSRDEHAKAGPALRRLRQVSCRRRPRCGGVQHDNMDWRSFFCKKAIAGNPQRKTSLIFIVLWFYRAA